MPLINHAGGGGGTPQLCPQVENFIATPENLGATLTWSAPSEDEDSSFVGVRIVRKVGSIPTSINDGAVVYEGTAFTYTDTGLTAGTTYYYRAFAYNAKKKYQTSLCTASLTAIPGTYAYQLPIGTRIVFPVDGVATNYIVVHQGKPDSSDYDDTADGTWIMSEKTFYTTANHSNGFRWNVASMAYVAYGTSALCAELDAKPSADGGYSVDAANAIKTYYPEDVLSRIRTVNVPYRPKGGKVDSTLKVSAQLFAPSLAELGVDFSYTVGAKLDYFLSGEGAEALQKRVMQRQNSSTAVAYWTRDPSSSSAYASTVLNTGQAPHSDMVTTYRDVPVFSVLFSNTRLSASPNSSGAYTFI